MEDGRKISAADTGDGGANELSHSSAFVADGQRHILQPTEDVSSDGEELLCELVSVKNGRVKYMR